MYVSNGVNLLGRPPAIQKPVLCRGLVLKLIQGKSFTPSKNAAPLYTREPARCFFAVSCRRYITVVYSYFLQSNPFNAFTSSCLAAQLSLQKSKEKVNGGLKTHNYTNNDCSVICAEKVMCIYSCKGVCIFNTLTLLHVHMYLDLGY